MSPALECVPTKKIVWKSGADEEAILNKEKTMTETNKWLRTQKERKVGEKNNTTTMKHNNLMVVGWG